MEADQIKIGGRWILLRNQFLGGGAFGKVYKGQDTKTGDQVAIKEINLKIIQAKNEDFTLSNAIRELNNMMQCSQSNNSHLVKLLGFKLDDDHENIYMVTELCDGTLGDLKKQKGSFSEKEALEYGRQIAEGLIVIHDDLGMTHRDLKFDNILHKAGVLKITDFGISKFEDPKSSTNGIINIVNCAPETIMYDVKGFSVDVWALGLIIHELIFSRHPFHAEGKDINSIPGSVEYQPY